MKQLEIPCSYQGGKQRLARDILQIICNQNTFDKDTRFYDLCSGSGAITLELINQGFNPQNIVMLDVSSWGKFWKAVGLGDFNLKKFKKYIDLIPTDVSKIQAFMKALSKKDANIDEEYVYLLLQASSFGGKQVWKEGNKWRNSSFRSYWLPTETSSRRSPVNPMMPMPDSLYKRVKDIVNFCMGVNCVNDNIYSIIDCDFNNSIIYIDPPYKDTTKYGFTFDVIDLLSKLKKNDTINTSIYVSEGYSFTSNSICISKGRSKGGISGERRKVNEEWLNIVV